MVFKIGVARLLEVCASSRCHRMIGTKEVGNGLEDRDSGQVMSLCCAQNSHAFTRHYPPVSEKTQGL